MTKSFYNFCAAFVVICWSIAGLVVGYVFFGTSYNQNIAMMLLCTCAGLVSGLIFAMPFLLLSYTIASYQELKKINNILETKFAIDSKNLYLE